MLKYFALLAFPLLCAAQLALIAGCSTHAPSVAEGTDLEAFTHTEKQALDTPPRRLITDYADMQQSNSVAWVWIKPGFSWQHLRSATLQPLQNLTGVRYPWAERKLTDALQELFMPAENRADTPGTIGLMAAIVAMVPEEGLLDRLFPDFDDYPYIEIELVFYEEGSNRVVGKVCHYGKDAEFSEALDALLDDIQVFFSLTTRTPA